MGVISSCTTPTDGGHRTPFAAFRQASFRNAGAAESQAEKLRMLTDARPQRWGWVYGAIRLPAQRWKNSAATPLKPRIRRAMIPRVLRHVQRTSPDGADYPRDRDQNREDDGDEESHVDGYERPQGGACHAHRVNRVQRPARGSLPHTRALE